MIQHDIIINDNLSAVAIPKCAMTELKAIAIHEKKHVWVAENEINDVFGHSNKFNKIKKRIRFAVYRNPFDRLVSFYYNKVINPNTFKVYKELYGWGNGSVTFEQMMDAIRRNFSKFNHGKDIHIRKQTDYYNIHNVDFIVKIEDLTDFLKSYGVEVPEKNINASVKGDDNFEEYRKEIEDLYKADYDILKSDKIWKHI